MKKIFLTTILLSFVACAGSGTSIFPTVSTSLVESDVNFPNPLSLAVDPARNQLYLANSNVDVSFETGSFAILDFDATNPSQPIIRAKDVISVPNFCGEILYDGVGTVWIPFREAFEPNSSLDTLLRLGVAKDSVVSQNTQSMLANPYGVARNGNQVFIVSDDSISEYTINGSFVESTSLESFDSTLTDANSRFIQDMSIDSTTGLGYLTNPGGRVFVVDTTIFTTDNEPVRQTLLGPTSSRDVVVDSTNRRLYIVDGITETVWVYNIDALPAPDADDEIEEVEDNSALLAQVSVGNNPNGMVLDSTNNRLYVANTADDTVSVIDTLSLTEILQIDLGEGALVSDFSARIDEPRALALGTFSSTQYLFVVGYRSGNIAVIKTSDNDVVQFYPNVSP